MGRYLDSRARRLFRTKEKKRLPQQTRRGKKPDHPSADDHNEKPEPSKKDTSQ